MCGSKLLTPAHLLSDHNYERSESGSADAGNGKEFEESSNIVALSNNGSFLGELCMDVVQITRLRKNENEK